MIVNNRIQILEEILEKFCTLLDPFKPLLNSHNVQFLTDNHWNDGIKDEAIRNDLLYFLKNDLNLVEYLFKQRETSSNEQ